MSNVNILYITLLLSQVNDQYESEAGIATMGKVIDMYVPSKKNQQGKHFKFVPKIQVCK